MPILIIKTTSKERKTPLIKRVVGKNIQKLDASNIKVEKADLKIIKIK